MLRGGKQLPVQVELDVIIDGYVRIVGRVRPAQCLYLLGIVGGILGPLAEIRGLVGITQVAEDGIWLQPFLVGFVEITESIRCQHLFPFLLEDEVEVFPLCLVHSFVVHGGQGIQFFLAFVEFGHHLLVLQAAQLLQVGVHGMEGIDGDATVRVGVCPGMRHGSVVDGQNLHRLLIGGNCPVNHALQVAEIAYTEAFLGAQGEYGYGYSGTFPCRKIEVYITVADSQRFVGGYLRVGHIAVGIVLPGHGTALFLVVKDEFILQREADFTGIHFYLPFGEVDVAHKGSFVRVPVTQRLLVSAECQAMVAVYAGGVRLYQQPLFVAFRGGTAFAMRQQGFCESGCIKILLLGQILPTIFYAVNFLRIVCNVQDAWQAVPLCPYGSAISIDVVTVFDASITGNLDIHFRGPVNAVYSVQGGGFVGLVVAKFRDGTQDSDFFTPAGAILDIEY